jgi:polyphosphate kinase 2
MKLSHYHKAKHSGLYISKQPHDTLGYKYVARFQINNKRHTKVLGYSLRDNLTEHKAVVMLRAHKRAIKQTAFDHLKQAVKVLKNNKGINNALKDFDEKDRVMLKKSMQQFYEKSILKKYQAELLKLQDYISKKGKKLIVLFEGRDASGKGGSIRNMTRYMNARRFTVVALAKPTADEQNQWFFQRYTSHFPTSGEMVLFDRSWYNRAMVEPVFNFCTEKQYKIFMEDVVPFENGLIRQGIDIIKFYFSVSKEEQKARFASRKNDKLKQWKLSPVDLQAQKMWDEFSVKKYNMLKQTSSQHAPWHIIRSDNKFKARVESMKLILNLYDYPNKTKGLNLTHDKEVYVSVAKELKMMKKKRTY